MTKVVDLQRNPAIKESKRLAVCECGNRHFKIVVYERFKGVAYFECLQCELAYKASEEIEDLETAPWT